MSRFVAITLAITIVLLSQSAAQAQDALACEQLVHAVGDSAFAPTVTAGAKGVHVENHQGQLYVAGRDDASGAVPLMAPCFTHHTPNHSVFAPY